MIESWPHVDNLTDLLTDWRRHLTARNRAPRTITDYLTTGEMFVGWLTDEDRPLEAQKVRASTVEDWLVALSQRPSSKDPRKTLSASSVAHHYRNLQQFFAFLVKDEIIEKTPFTRLSAPSVPEKPVPVLNRDQIKTLIADCSSKDIVDLRDAAIIRILADTGMRVSELVGITLEDLDFATDSVLIMGKGRRPRIAPFGAKTGDAIRRYMRARTSHPYAKRPELLIGYKGPMTDSGVRQMLERRGERTNISGVHPHRFRHTFANEWLSNGGAEVDLQRLAGWKSRDMLARYGASAADQRAREAHKRAGLGDRF